MIWESVFLMSVIDVLIIFAAIYLVAVLYKNYRATRKLGLASGVNLILLGLTAIALFYFADLLVMHVLPSFSSHDYAMAAMTDLHLNWSWANTLIAVGAITIGLSYVLQRVIPRASFALDDLERRVHERTATLTAINAELRESEQRYRSLYTKTPVMLHSSDADGRLVGVSDHWLKTLGYERNEVIGQPPTNFLTEASRLYINQVCLPAFMKTGIIIDEPLRFEKKNGEIVDVLLSAIAERDADENFARSLAVSVDVTQRKHAEDELRKSEQALREKSILLQTTLDTIDQGLAVFDKDLRAATWSRTYEKLIYIPPELLKVGTPYEDLVRYNAEQGEYGPGNVEQQVEKRMQHARSGRRSSIEWERLDGRILAYENYPIPGGGLVTTAMDITERKRAQLALEEQRQHLQTVVDTVPGAVHLKDKQGRWVFVNEFMAKSVGLKAEDLIGKTARDVLGKHAEVVRKFDRQVLETGKPILSLEIESQGRTAGDRAWHMNKAPIFEENGQVIGVVTAALDITERKRAEEALRISEAKFSRAFRSSPDAITISSLAEGHFIDVNNSFERISGYNREEVVGRTAVDLNFWNNDEDRANFVRRLSARGSVRDLEAQLNMKSGEVRTFSMSAETIKFGDELCMVLISRDITERKRLEERTRQQEMQLIQGNKMTALGIMVSGVAHEINNPNNMILMNAQVLAEAWRDAAKLLDKHYQQDRELMLGGLPYVEMREHIPSLISDVHDGAQRIQKIVDNLRDYSRPRQSVVQATLNVNEIIERSLAVLSHLIKQTTANVAVELAEDLPSLKGDAQKIEQVVINLVINALEALPNDDGHIKISTLFNKAEDCVEIRVQDQGVGIPPEHLQRIYEPFFTTKQDSGGTGLGLAITYRLVRDHGGILLFESKPGQGTLAIASLPIGAKQGVNATLVSG